MCVYLRTKFQFFTIILMSFRWGNFTSTPAIKGTPLKSPPRLRLRYKVFNHDLCIIVSLGLFVMNMLLCACSGFFCLIGAYLFNLSRKCFFFKLSLIRTACFLIHDSALFQTSLHQNFYSFGSILFLVFI